jgi:hypothetical protein
MGNFIMTENNSEPNVPAKPVQPPMLNEEHAGGTLVSDHPAIKRNVTPKFGGWSKRKPDANPLKSTQATSVVTLNQTPNGGSRPIRARGKLAWYWAAGAGGLLLAIGIGIGVTLPDPTNSKEYAALTSEKEGLQSDLGKLQARFNNLDAGIKDREAKVQAREGIVATSDAAVKKREEAVTATEKTIAASTIAEGTWTVGVDIEPGTYRANANIVGSCYWGIYRTGSNGSDIVDNDNVSGGRPSVTLSAGQDFKTSRCGTWSKQ